MRMRKGLLALIFVLCGAVAWAQGVSDEATAAAVAAFSTGQEAVQKRDWDTAIPALEKALSLNPELFLSHFYLGASYLAKQNTAQAIEHFQVFIQRAQSDAGQAANVTRAQRALGLLYAADKKWAEAIPFLKAAVAAKADDIEVRAQLAQAFIVTKDEAGAEEQLVKLMELNPKGAPFFFRAGVMAYQRKDDAAARQRLDAFVKLTPDGAQAGQAYFMLGQISRRANDSETAKAHFTKYLATNPPPGPQVEAVKQFLESPPATGSPSPTQ